MGIAVRMRLTYWQSPVRRHTEATDALRNNAVDIFGRPMWQCETRGTERFGIYEPMAMNYTCYFLTAFLFMISRTSVNKRVGLAVFSKEPCGMPLL